MSKPVLSLLTDGQGNILTDGKGNILTEYSVVEPDGFTSLPADVAEALNSYNRRVADGTLVFDSEGFAASSNPGFAEADAGLRDLVTSHICD